MIIFFSPNSCEKPFFCVCSGVVLQLGTGQLSHSGSPTQMLLALTSTAAFLSITRDKETLFLAIFRPGEGHSPEAHGSDRAQTSTTDLQTGANTGSTPSLTSVKVMGQGNKEVSVGQSCQSILHPPHPSLMPLCHSISSLSLYPHFLSSSFPSSSLCHIVFPSVPPLCLVTFPFLHPLLSCTPGTQRGPGNLPCLIPGPLTPWALNIHDREKHFMANWTHIQLEMEIL